jgi:hypothetical protein
MNYFPFVPLSMKLFRLSISARHRWLKPTATSEKSLRDWVIA